LQKIKESGFHIAMQKEMVLSREQVEDFYSCHKDQPYFEALVRQMTRLEDISLSMLFVKN